jgi:large subunit ribosomal protein L3
MVPLLRLPSGKSSRYIQYFLMDGILKIMTAKAHASKYVRLLGKKTGMIQMFDQAGNIVPCTVIHAEPNVITQIKTMETDGYQAIQLGFDEITVKDARTLEKRVGQPLRGHFAKAGVTPRRHLVESHVDDTSKYTLGQRMSVALFQDIAYVDVLGVSKGKGYQGVMKLHGFQGGPASHGSGFHRHAGSTGMRSSPGRCLPGGKRASHMGDRNVTVQNLRVVAIDETNNLIIVEGATPGARGGLLVITESKKKKKQ